MSSNYQGAMAFHTGLERGYNVLTRKRKWACINGRYVQVPAKTSSPKVVRNPGRIKAGIGRQMDRFPA